ncbi:hypothetical protein GCM10014713_22340 [Streptomyces purpureus]|uniref:Uncharacterized protein n=1 Tax=Streptomyces purpureus TaxID=1951 RepID=A0A918H1W0_9ACTN|nr:hypothetical protein GCM10014713_22340 [Streptomyces purpureus]
MAGGVALWAGGAAVAAPASAAPKDRQWRKNRSANGWPVLEAATTYGVEGSPVDVALAPGAAATVLLYVARRFHYEVAALKAGEITGHTRRTAVTAAYESNHLSGTAIAIKPGAYPTGAGGCLFPHELAVVRDILTECEGVVRWGGDDRRSPKEGHFQIDVAPGSAALHGVARKIGGWEEQPDQGAGVPTDVFDRGRRSAAKRLADRQRATS